jgi:hypothetical protein
LLAIRLRGHRHLHLQLLKSNHWYCAVIGLQMIRLRRRHYYWRRLLEVFALLKFE